MTKRQMSKTTDTVNASYRKKSQLPLKDSLLFVRQEEFHSVKALKIPEK